MKILKILSSLAALTLILTGCSTHDDTTIVEEAETLQQSGLEQSQSSIVPILETGTPINSLDEIATTWVADTFIKNGEDIEIKSPNYPYITIAKDGSFRGKTPCNSYEGQIEVNEDGFIHIEPIVITLGLCAQKDLNEIEANYLELLDSINGGWTGQLSNFYSGLFLFNTDSGQGIRFFQGE